MKTADLFSNVHDKDVKDDDTKLDPETITPFVKAGDLWTLGRHKIVSNAARYLTGAAKDSAIGFSTSSVQNTYSQDSSVTLSGNSFYVRDEQDIRSLAIEIVTLTRRQQRGRGLRMA